MHSMNTADTPRLLRFADVRSRVGLSRTTIWRMERAGKFPKRIELTPRAVAWREADIVAWIAQQQPTN